MRYSWILPLVLLATPSLHWAADPASAASELITLDHKAEIKHDASASDGVVSELQGLASVAEFLAVPRADLFIYRFDPWPSQKDELPAKDYTFSFSQGPGRSVQQVQFSALDATTPPKRVSDQASHAMTGVGKLDWNATIRQTFRFQRPVLGFGVVLRSTADMELRRFYWAGAVAKNGFPLSYTLSDGTVVQLGKRETRGALIPGNRDVFVGVLDRSKRGIISVDFALRGLAEKQAQGLQIKSLVFATPPQTSNSEVADLTMSRDLISPDQIVSGVRGPGSCSVEEFREIAGTHRYVYDQWPVGLKDSLQLDLQGDGKVAQRIKLDGVDTSQVAAAEQTFTFEKPVWAFGATYLGPGNEKIAIQYTLADGSVLNTEASLEGGRRTFVGLRDTSDNGIASVALSRPDASQRIRLESVAFALAGPPPGNWKLVFSEEFDGDALDPNRWSPGYTFVDVINNELQAYVPENIKVNNGVCTIVVEKRDSYNVDRNGNKGALQKFASGAFTSYDKFVATYGYFEARVRMPHGRGAGVWPAFWMLPDRGRDYPFELRRANMTKEHGRGVEIDIFEYMPWWRQQDGTYPMHVGCIWSYRKKTKEDQAPRGFGSYALANNGWGPGEVTYKNLDTEFHTYGVYWSPERIIWYIDGKPVFRVRDPEKVPDVPHYFLFNIAVSLNGWGKSPDKKHPTMDQIVADMPNSMDIDYFRAYSGQLIEAIPASPTDNPEIVRKYDPPREGYVYEPWPPTPVAAPSAAPAEKGAVPAAPANAEIVTPAN